MVVINPNNEAFSIREQGLQKDHIAKINNLAISIFQATSSYLTKENIDHKIEDLKIDVNLNINPDLSEINIENIDRIKALQFIYTSDVSEQKLIEISINYQTIDIMVFIVGLTWPSFQYEQTISLPQDNRIEYPENIRVINEI